jgi:hypothetical protein
MVVSAGVIDAAAVEDALRVRRKRRGRFSFGAERAVPGGLASFPHGRSLNDSGSYRGLPEGKQR